MEVAPTKIKKEETSILSENEVLSSPSNVFDKKQSKKLITSPTILSNKKIDRTSGGHQEKLLTE